MFYTVPSYEYKPNGVDFGELGAEPGTRVWLAMRLTIPKFVFVVEFRAGERKELSQTIYCSDAVAVATHIELVGAKQCAVYLQIPAAASDKNVMELRPVVEIIRGDYKPGMFKPKQSAYIMIVDDGRRFVDIYGLDEKEIIDRTSVFNATSKQTQEQSDSPSP